MDLTILSDLAIKSENEIQCQWAEGNVYEEKKSSYKYTMIGSKLAITIQENGLEVMADSSLNIWTECLVAVKQQIGF